MQVLFNDECLYSTKDLTSAITSDVFTLSTSESIEEEPAETKELCAPEETEDEETVMVAEESLEEKEFTVNDEVKSKEMDSVESYEPVESTPPAKEQSTDAVSILLL